MITDPWYFMRLLTPKSARGRNPLLDLTEFLVMKNLDIPLGCLWSRRNKTESELSVQCGRYNHAMVIVNN